jgi:hypothetical protein
MKCTGCEVEIDPRRLKALPGTKTCVKCSDVTPYRVLINTNVEKEDVNQEIIVYRG